MCIGGGLWCCGDDIPVNPHILPYPIPSYHHNIIAPPYPRPTAPTQVLKPIPLTGVVVSVKVVDFVAEVTLQQRYENIEDVPIEATYIFPLEEKASVSSFHAVVDGKKVTGILKEKEKARDVYDDAIASGNSAFLLEQVEDKENTFKTSIGNLPPHSEVLISVVYVTELNFNPDQTLEFVLPTNTRAYPDGKLNPRFWSPSTNVANSANIPYGLSVTLDLEMTSIIKGLASPSHPVTYEHTGQKASVKLATGDPSAPLTSDFHLNISLTEPNKPVFRVQKNIAMLALYPDLQTDDDPITEMIFLVDRSGSMSGPKIQRVKDTMQIFLRSLPLGTLFNIVGFGSSFKTLFTKSTEYDDSSLAEATAHVTELKANLGGTNLLAPLQSILQAPTHEGIPRQLFVLTDGEVDNTQACIDFVRKHSNSTRVFAFGIHGASPELVNGIAKAGEGKAELILGNENLENKVMGQLKRALQPALTNLQVSWGPLNAEQTPFNLPQCFNGSRVIVYGYLPKDATKGTISFKADTVNGPYTFALEVDPSEAYPGDFIPKLAARSMIRDLEEGRSYYHSPNYVHAKNIMSGISAPEVQAKIIELSLKSGMLSKYTAFVAVNESNKAVEGSMETRNINQQLQQQQQQQQQQQAQSPRNRIVAGSVFASIPAAPLTQGVRSGGHDAMKKYGRAPAAKSSIAFDSSDWAAAPRRESESLLMDYDPFSSAPIAAAGAAPPPPAPLSNGFSYSSMQQQHQPKAPQHMAMSSGFSVSRSSSSSPSSSFHSLPSSSPSFQSSSTLQAKSSFQPLPSSTPEKSSAAATLPSGGVKGIVMRQKAAGNFTEDVLQSVGVTLTKLKSHTPASLSSLPASILDQILIILFVCGHLHKTYQTDKEQWELVEKKGYTWIKKEVKKVGGAEQDWKTIAIQLANSV